MTIHLFSGKYGRHYAGKCGAKNTDSQKFTTYPQYVTCKRCKRKFVTKSVINFGRIIPT